MAGPVRRIHTSTEEDRMMSRTRRMIAVGVFITLAVLGTGWALEKAFSGSDSHAGAVGEPTSAGDTVGRPALPTDTSPEYDRSDLILSQG
jgi:hypothetical protein